MGNHRAINRHLKLSCESHLEQGTDGEGRGRGGSGLGTHVHPWQIHVDIWQNQYNIVKLKNKILKKGKKFAQFKKIKFKKKVGPLFLRDF